MDSIVTSAAPENEISDIAACIPQAETLIRIDGHSAVGKSRIAKALANFRGWKLIQVDRYIDRDRPGKYVQKIRRDRLYRDLGNSKAQGQIAIVDGIMLDHLLPTPPFDRGFRIYVKAAAAALTADENDRRRQLGTDLYHKRCKPEDTADLVLFVPYESNPEVPMLLP